MTTPHGKIRLTMARLLIELGRAGEAVRVCTDALQLCNGAAESARGLILQAAAMRWVDRIDDGFAALRAARPLARRSSLALARSWTVAALTDPCYR